MFDKNKIQGIIVSLSKEEDMLFNALRAILLICGVTIVVIATLLAADHLGVVRVLGRWWNDLLCYIASAFASDQFQELSPLIIAILLLIAGITCIKIALSMQRKQP